MIGIKKTKTKHHLLPLPTLSKSQIKRRVLKNTDVLFVCSIQKLYKCARFGEGSIQIFLPNPPNPQPYLCVLQSSGTEGEGVGRGGEEKVVNRGNHSKQLYVLTLLLQRCYFQ